MNNSSRARLYREGLNSARAITRQWAKTFYFASHLLTREKRDAAYAVYAICRISDDAVDGSTKNPRQSLAVIKTRIASSYEAKTGNDGLALLFSETIKKYTIPKHCFDELISGMETDLVKTRYETFEELYEYCYKVAGVVGLMMLKIFGHNNPAAEPRAVELGVAMQLTNILRDIKEDFKKGRVYLPQKEMREFGVSDQTIAGETLNDAFIAFMKFQICRARDFYQKADAGIAMISDPAGRRTALLMKNIYAAILEAIERNHYDIFSRRASVALPRKLSIALHSLLKGTH